MDINLTTPALLFPTISLLMLAYTNRFLALANLIRDLHAKYKAAPDPIIIAQIDNLRYRVILIRNMQGLGVVSLILCVICMFVLFAGWALAGKIIFGLSLLFMVGSLALALREIQVSVDALMLHLRSLETEDAAVSQPPR
jgi:hypothetical protein